MAERAINGTLYLTFSLMPEKPPANVDGISSPANNKQVLSRARFAVITIAAVPYGLYIVWSLFLVSVLPDPDGSWNALIPIGKLGATFGAAALFFVAVFAVMRIGKAKKSTDSNKYMGFVRIGAFVLPGLLLSGIVPYIITQEPSLPLQMVSPAEGSELVAPLSITFSAEKATDILQSRGVSTQNYQWDFNADGTIDAESVTPESTAYFDRQGGYTVVARLQLSDGSTRTIQRRVVIPNAVFSYTPFTPIVDEPVRFSIAHLVSEEMQQQLREVQWDFDDDGVPDETTTDLDAEHTFVRTGDQKVTVTMYFLNQTQNTFFRTISIQEPLPNPFPISIGTTPEFLESPPPFQVVFTLESEEPLQDIAWDYGDNTPQESGERVGHTFRNRGSYQVKVQARNLNGEVAKASTVIRVVENLSVPDLAFDGSHRVDGNRISAEAPVAITLTPKTVMPLLEFWWEAPNASEVSSTDTTLDAIYRQPGLYNLILLGKDAEGRVMRRAIQLDVKPKSTFIDFQVRPTQPIAPEVVMFDASESFIPDDQITGFIWNFGETEQERFGDAREEYEYTQAGSYTVTLTVNTLSGRSETKQKTVIVRAPELKACYTMSRNTVTVNSGILFDWSCTTGDPTSIVWDFGDGAQAESNPSGPYKIDHIYEIPGSYEVRLKVEDANSSLHTFTQRVTVQ